GVLHPRACTSLECRGPRLVPLPGPLRVNPLREGEGAPPVPGQRAEPLAVVRFQLWPPHVWQAPLFLLPSPRLEHPRLGHWQRPPVSSRSRFARIERGEVGQGRELDCRPARRVWWAPKASPTVSRRGGRPGGALAPPGLFYVGPLPAPQNRGV